MFSTTERAGYRFILSNELSFISEYRLHFSGAFTVYIYWIKGLLKNKSKQFTLSITFPMETIFESEFEFNIEFETEFEFAFEIEFKL